MRLIPPLNRRGAPSSPPPIHAHDVENLVRMPSNLAQQSLSGEICNPAGELQKALQKLQGEHAAAAEEAKVKQQELQESLQNALKVMCCCIERGREKGGGEGLGRREGVVKACTTVPLAKDIGSAHQVYRVEQRLLNLKLECRIEPYSVGWGGVGIFLKA